MIDLPTIKGWLGITTGEFDTQLTGLRDRLTERIQTRLDWYFGTPRQTVEYLNGSNRAFLFLRQPPANGVVALAYRYGANGWRAYEADEFEVAGRKLINIGAGFWSHGLRNIRATYLEGFDEPPGDVAQLLLDMLQANITVTSGAALGDVTSEKIGDYSYTIKEGSASAALESSSHWSDVYNSWKRGRI